MADDKHRLLPMAWVLQSFRHFPAYLLETLVLATVLKLLALISPFAMQALIDRVLPFERQSSLNILFALLVGVSLFEAALSYSLAQLTGWYGSNVYGNIERRALDHVLHLPLRVLSGRPIGELLARLDEINKVRSFIGYTTTTLLLDAFFALFYSLLLLTISPTLTGILLSAIPVQLAMYFVFGPLQRRRFDRSFTAGSRHSARIIEILSGITTVKSLGAERHAFDRASETLNAAISSSFHANSLVNMAGQLSSMADKLIVAAIIYVGAMQVIAGTLTLGQLVAFHLLSSHVSAPIMALASIWDDWQNILVARRRVGEVLLLDREPNESIKALSDSEIRNSSIELVNLEFAYDPRYPVVRNLSLILPKSGLVAITGKSGIGKTTLAKLMAGLEAPTSGEVRFMGVSQHQWGSSNYRRWVTYHPQDPFIFSGTIRENLSLASQTSDVEMTTAIKSVGLSLGQLPPAEMLDVMIGEGGVTLSGGQRQRVSLARAILHNSKVLILDEPFSALDNQSAGALMKLLSQISAKSLVVLISHSSPRDADCDIIVSFGHQGKVEIKT